MAVGQVFATPEDNGKWNNQRYVEKTKKIRQLMISSTFQAHSN